MRDLAHIMAYDIGGSHATVGIVDSGSLALTCVDACAIDSNGTADSILDAIRTLGEGALAEARRNGTPPDGVAIAVPGPFDYENGISLLCHKYASLYGMDLRQMFEAAFGLSKDKIVFINDAQAFLLGECHAGAARYIRRCIGLTLGTGVGSAFSIDGTIVETGIGVPPGGEIYCLSWEGHTVEDTISTRAIQNRYRQLCGETKSVRDICIAAPKDRNATLVMNEFGSNLGLVLRDICSAFRPDAIVLGGAISRSAELFLSSAMVSAGDNTGKRLRVCERFDDAPLIGAAVRCVQSIVTQA